MFSDKNEPLKLTAKSINKTFGQRLLPARVKADQQPEILLKLAAFVKELLQTDMHRLLQALYRLDVDERKVKNALQQNSVDEVAAALAQLIFDREMQRVITRQRYSGN